MGNSKGKQLSNDLQVLDDLDLLDLMLSDLKAAPPEYQLTNYWGVYAHRFLPELRRMGLRDFRRRRHSVLSSFGATDHWPVRRIDLTLTRLGAGSRIGAWTRLLHFVSDLLNGVLPFSSGVEPETLAKLAFESTRRKGASSGARPLESLEASLYGNPESRFFADGKAYTLSILDYYLRYAYACQFVDFDRISMVVELGAGLGKQVEVLKKLHPRLCILVFEIPPQLYVCHQYLRAVFPDDCISYRMTRQMSRLPPNCQGKILVFGNWQFPMLETITADLFWNAASFQEMEPEVTLNYLATVNRSAKAVLLHEVMSGKERAARKGQHGVLEPTTLAHYRRGLANFRLADLSVSETPLGLSRDHSDSFWVRTDTPEKGPMDLNDSIHGLRLHVMHRAQELGNVS